MSLQKFIARERFEFSNGAIGYRPGGFADCIGPFAKVENCPVADSGGMLRTAYASGYADTFFSVPAAMSYRGQRVAGYFTSDDGDCVFHVLVRHQHRIPVVEHNRALQAMRERLDSLTSSVHSFYRSRHDGCTVQYWEPKLQPHNARWMPKLRHAWVLIAWRIAEIRTLRSTIATFEANSP